MHINQWTNKYWLYVKRRARSTTQLVEQMSAEVKHYYKSLFHLAFVLLKDMNFMEAIRIWSIQLNFKSLKEGQGKAVEGYLSEEYVFVYSRTRSELLRDPDRLRELSLDLSKKNRMTKFLYRQRKGIAAHLHRPFYELKRAVLKAVVDRWRTFGKSAFILFRLLRLRFSIVILSTELYRIKVLPD